VPLSAVARRYHDYDEMGQGTYAAIPTRMADTAALKQPVAADEPSLGTKQSESPQNA